MINEKKISREDEFLRAFNRKIRSQVRIHLFFAVLILAEIGAFVAFLPFFLQSAIVALMVAAILLTVFGFLLLRQYLNSEKLTYYESILNQMSQEEENEAKDLVERGNLYAHLADRLYNHEYGYYALPKRFHRLKHWIEPVSAYLHWKDVHDMRELLLKASVQEHIRLVRQEPTNPDAHALLANAYVMLSGLYIAPGTLENEEKDKWIPKHKYSADMQLKFEETAKKAVEEFKILKEYAPNDPWIYSQLAYSYRDLRMKEAEREAYETILSLRPQDHDTRFKLGMLCFEQGKNAKGLKIYEDLKKAHYSSADELLKAYGEECK